MNLFDQASVARPMARPYSLIRRSRSAHTKLLAGALLLLLCAPARAEDLESSRPITLGPGDKIGIVVFGQAELSGEVVVDGTGSVAMPLVGTVNLRNLTTLEAEKRITDRLGEGVLKHPVVSVKLLEFRPVYVFGDVRAPGGYAFRPGSIVQSMIAVAGGYGTTAQGMHAVASDVVQADERVHQLALQKRTLMVRLARVEAQRDADGKFPPSYLVDVIDDGVLPDLIAAEIETFVGHAAILVSQKSLLKLQKQQLESEIAAVNSQIVSETKQRELTTQQLKQYDQLIKKGLGRNATQFDMLRSEARHESEIWRLSAELSRLRVTSGELDIKLNEIDIGFKKQVLAELREVRQRLKELDVLLPAAHELRQVRLSLSPTSEPSYLIKITRMRDGRTEKFRASETTMLEPGDIVEIKRDVPAETVVRSVSVHRVGDGGWQEPRGGSVARSRTLPSELKPQQPSGDRIGRAFEGGAEPKRNLSEGGIGETGSRGSPQTRQSGARSGPFKANFSQ